MASFIFSRDVQEYLKYPESSVKQLLYKVLYEKREQIINPLLNPSSEDIDAIMAKVSAINNYCIESCDIVNGILHIKIALGGIQANVMASRSCNDVCNEILVCYRQHWMNTRGLDPAPFITLLTPRVLQLAVPVSTQGYRTLAEMQDAQLSVKRKQLQANAATEVRKANALKTFNHF